MKLPVTLIATSLRMLATVGLLHCNSACADEYADVSQLARAGKFTEALTRADHFLAGQPKDPQMRFIKGVIQRDSGKTADAVTTFARLTEDYPELPEPYNNLAVLYASQSQFEKARNALETAIRTNPSYATAHENLGDVYAKLASQAYNKALQLDGGNLAVPPKLALIREIFSTSKVPPAGAAKATVASKLNTPQVAVSPPPAVIAHAGSAAPAAVAPVAMADLAMQERAAPATAMTADNAAAKEVEAAVANWARAWSAKNLNAYLAAYGRDFVPPGSMARKAWEDERRTRISNKASINVTVDRLGVSVNGNHAVARFRQEYKSGSLALVNNKTLDLAKVGSQWLIVKENVAD